MIVNGERIEFPLPGRAQADRFKYGAGCEGFIYEAQHVRKMLLKGTGHFFQEF